MVICGTGFGRFAMALPSQWKEIAMANGICQLRYNRHFNDETSPADALAEDMSYADD
jgi:hypothetical protein